MLFRGKIREVEQSFISPLKAFECVQTTMQMKIIYHFRNTNSMKKTDHTLRKGYMLLLVLVFAWSFTQTTQTFNTNGTWTVPPGTTIITPTKVEAWGAGGGGGGAYSYNYIIVSSTGRGGGGGGYTASNVTLSPGNYNYVVGNGGTGGNKNTDGTNGTDSYWGTVRGSGGAGGKSGDSNNATGATGGAGGSGNFKGGDGSNSSSSASGTGGGGAGSTGAGATPTGGTGDAGGAGGNGGNRLTSSGDGQNGSAIGGGGSGAYSAASVFNSLTHTGGSGANGQIRITYYYPTISSVSKSVLCPGESFTITGTNFNTTTGVTIGGTSVSAFTVNSKTQITVTAGAGTTGVVRVTTTHGSAVTATAVTVNPNVPVSVSIATPTNIICVGVGAAQTFTATPTNGGTSPMYQWKINGVNVGTNSPTFTSSTLTVGDQVSVVLTSNANPCLTSSVAVSNTITMATQTTVYNSGSWSIPPAPNLSAIIQSDYSSDLGNLNVCSMSITNGAAVTIQSGDFLKLQNGLHVIDGNFTIESDGNLIQVNDGIVNTGNITVKREVSLGAARNQYNYLGSPVAFQSGETYKTMFPGSATTVLYHNQTNNFFGTSSGANVPGRGSAVKEPTISASIPATASRTTARYKGVPQNGTITIAIANKDTSVNTFGYNLLGNPYASNLDLLELYAANGGKAGAEATQVISPNISPTFYFWDNNGNTQISQQGTGYSGQAYAIFNVLTGPNGTGTKSSLGGKVPTNILKVGQGFMTRSLKSSYNFIFNNSIRTKSTTTNDFLGKGNTAAQSDRYWLEMTAPSGITSTIAVVHYDGGNEGYGSEDSRSIGASDAIYTLVEGEEIAIDGRSSFSNSAVIPLGTQHFVQGNYTIAIDKSEGVFANGQSIYLKDKHTGTVINLSEGSYTFATNEGKITGRFEIIYQPDTVLLTESNVKSSIEVYRDGTNFVVRAPKEIAKVELYDLSGKMVKKVQANGKTVTLEASFLAKGIYVLRIATADGEIANKKIMK